MGCAPAGGVSWSETTPYGSTEQVRANPEAAYDHTGVGINPLVTGPPAHESPTA